MIYRVEFWNDLQWSVFNRKVIWSFQFSFTMVKSMYLSEDINVEEKNRSHFSKSGHIFLIGTFYLYENSSVNSSSKRLCMILLWMLVHSVQIVSVGKLTIFVTCIECQGPFYQHSFILIPACCYIYYKVWNEIIYPIPSFNCAAIEFWKWIININT